MRLKRVCGTRIALNKRTHFPSFPERRRFTKEEMKAMRVLKKILFTIAMVAGLALAVSAQKDGKKPPKPNPPVVTPGPKNPPRENPPDSNKPKKPGFALLAIINETPETE